MRAEFLPVLSPSRLNLLNPPDTSLGYIKALVVDLSRHLSCQTLVILGAACGPSCLFVVGLFVVGLFVGFCWFCPQGSALKVLPSSLCPEVVVVPGGGNFRKSSPPEAG